MIHPKSTKRLIVVLVVLNVCAAALYGFLYYHVGAATRESAVIYSEIGADQEGQEALNNLEDSIANTEEAREKLDQYFVQENQTVDFLSEIESLGGVSGAQVKLTSVERVEGSSGSSNMLELSLEGQGAFSEVFYLANLIEHLPYKVSLRNVLFEVGAAEDEDFFQSEASALPSPSPAPSEEGASGSSTATTTVTTTRPEPEAPRAGAIWGVSVDFTLESFDAESVSS